ncbi:MAG: FAD-dependent monooxygenase, partial [Candidatus Puniceispirillaceae bacterium]
MKPKGKGRWESLYFDYPVFAAPPRAGLARSAQVTIVGAGPIGMIAALTLAHHGQRCVIVDDKHTFNDGSRAICVARSSLVALQMLGIATPFLETSLAWRSGRSFFRGKQILEFFMEDSAEERHRPMYNLEQQYIEKFLHDAVDANPLIDMRWQTACTGVADLPEGDENETGNGNGNGNGNDAGVMLTLRDPDGSYEMRTGWLLAADGARSPIRAMKGLRLKGQNFEGRYVIADIQMRNRVPVERFALFDPDARPGSTVLVHQQPDDIWRIDYQLRDDEDEDEALREENIRAAVQRVLDECGYSAPWELEWWSVYSANTLLLDNYRHGRTIFIGDSAHIVPIFGVRGFNNGVLDGVNIGWKLAWHLAGKADEAILESYDHERRRATLDVIEKSGKSAQFMTPRTRGYAIMRDAALSLALDFPFASQFANPRNMTPYEY